MLECHFRTAAHAAQAAPSCCYNNKLAIGVFPDNQFHPNRSKGTSVARRPSRRMDRAAQSGSIYWRSACVHSRAAIGCF